MARAGALGAGRLGMIVYLVRHARAGSRADWEGDDRLRPLDKRGRRQADGLVAQLAGRELTRILSSPYVRCVQSVVPLAEARWLKVEPDDALAEGAGSRAALELLFDGARPVVVCVHGDLVEELLGAKMKKGATTVLDLTAEGIAVLERLDPPA
jgi:8-oxo-dGTP diphosphatase